LLATAACPSPDELELDAARALASPGDEHQLTEKEIRLCGCLGGQYSGQGCTEYLEMGESNMVDDWGNSLSEVS
jgi:hypothetical protein